MKKSELLRANYKRIIESMISLDAERLPYQVDLYMYPDGEITQFVNIGGNSWLDDNHICVWSVNHENENDPELLELSDDEYLDVCKEHYDFYADALERAIDRMECEECEQAEYARFMMNNVF